MQSKIIGRKSIALWVTSAVMVLLLAIPLAFAAGKPKNVTISGKVYYEDGTPIPGATILLLEGKIPKPGELPPFTPFARRGTDENGVFRFEATRKWAVIVELVGDHCDWNSVRVSLDQKELKNAATIHVDLVTSRDNVLECAQR